MTKNNYSWRRVDDYTRNVCAYEIKRSNTFLPYTVVIYNYSDTGDKQLFSDLFYSQSWDERRGLDGELSDDVMFCIRLWRELGMYEKTGEDFQPKHIEHDLDRVPKIYRRNVDQVMQHLFSPGKEIETCECCASFNCKRNVSRVVPINLTYQDSNEQIAEKIQEAFNQGLTHQPCPPSTYFPAGVTTHACDAQEHRQGLPCDDVLCLED